MSFLEELKEELQANPFTETPEPVLEHQNRLQRFVTEELSYLRQEIRSAARNGRFTTDGGRRIFVGTRMWHEGEHRHQTESLASFYSFLSQESILNKEVLSQHKRPLFGFHYEIRYSLSEKGLQYLQLFTEAMEKEGVAVNGLFMKDKNGRDQLLPYTASGNVKYDFELEHYINDYPKLYYTYRIEL